MKRWLFAASVAGAFVFDACVEHEPEVDRVGGPLPTYEAGSPVCLQDASTIVPDAGDGDVPDAPPCPLPCPDTPGAQIPCDVDAILDAKCRRCHSDPTVNGAPFPILTWPQTQEYSGKLAKYQKMFNAVSSGFMPYCGLKKTCCNGDPNSACLVGGSVEPLEEAEKARLLEWLSCPLPHFEVCP